LKSPADERREAAGFVLKLAQTFEGFDALSRGFDVAEHHRAGGTAAEFVPCAVNFEPIFGQALVDRDGIAYTIDKDLAAAAGQAAHAGVFEAREDLAQRQLVELVKMPDFRSAESVKIERRIARFEISEQILIPIKLQRRMIAALE